MKSSLILALPLFAASLHAQVIVTNTDDAGPGSLRDAIAAATAGDTISFDAGLANATISLTSGPLLIEKALAFDATPLSGVPALDQQLRLNTVGRQDAFKITVDPAMVTGLAGFEIEGRPPKPHYGTFLKFAAADGVAGDGFGDAMAQSENHLIVGAPRKVSDTGAAYVFTPETVVVPEPAGTRETPVVRRDWLQRAKLVADHGGSGDAFGSSVAVYGEIAVVGAPGEDGAGDATTDSGAAYVFVRDDAGAWTQQAVLRAGVPSASAEFGITVSIHGELIAVGAPGEEKAYLFQRSGSSWTQIASVVADNGVAGDEDNGGARFGAQVVVVGRALYVGAPRESSEGFRRGAVYGFAPDGGGVWTQQHFFRGNNTGVTDGFGSTLAIYANLLAVAAPFEDGEGDAIPDSGAVYLFDLSGAAPVQTALVKASNAGISDRFGASVAVAAGRLLVGAAYEDSAASGFDGDGADNDVSNSGAAYLFENSYGYWRQRSFSKAETPVAGGQYGRSVVLSSDTAFIAEGEEIRPFDSRSQYDFLRAEGLGSGSFRVPDDFGSTLDISGDTLVVGEPLHIDPSTSQFLGSAHIYRRNGKRWRRERTFRGTPNSRLGDPIAIDGDTMVAAGRNGIIRVFNRTGVTWTEGPNVPRFGVFGYGRTLAISGDRIAVGSGVHQNTGKGVTYIFSRTGNNWTHTHTLPAPEGEALSSVISIAMSGDRVVVAYRESGFSPRLGLLQVFDLASTEPEVPQGLSIGIGGEGAGRQIAMLGDVVVSMANQRVLVFRIPPIGGIAFEDQIKVGGFARTIGRGTSAQINDLLQGLSLSEAGLAVGTRDGVLHYLPRPTASGTIKWELQRRYQTRTDFSDPETDLSHSVTIAEDGVIVAGTTENTAQPEDQTGINPLEGDDFSDHYGAAFIFERPEPQIVLEDGGGMMLAPGSVLSFVSLEPGLAITRSFSLRNGSHLSLELGDLSFGGPDAALFEVITPPASTVAPGGSTTITLRFNPGPNPRASARIELLTNLADNDLFTVPLSGIAVTPNHDTDGDGLDDAFEAKFAALGFDFLTAQPDLVATYLATAGQTGPASAAGALFSQSQLGALRPETELLVRDSATGEFTFRLGLDRSTNLLNFTSFPFLPGATTIDPEGRLEFRFTDDGDRRFYRLELRD